MSGAVAALPLALHAAALHIARATDHGDLRTASEQLASAIQLVGIDGWPRFVAAAQAHAEMQPPLLVATPIPLASASPVVLARAQPVERHTSPPGSAASP